MINTILLNTLLYKSISLFVNDIWVLLRLRYKYFFNVAIKEKSYVQVTIPAYDANGNKVGDALANVNDLKPNSTWKFKVTYLCSEKNVTFKTEELKVSGF